MAKIIKRKNYKLSPELRTKYSALALLRHMVLGNITYSTLLEDEELFLKDLLQELFNNELVDLANDDTEYGATQKGRKKIEEFEAKKLEFIRVFGPLKFVDTGTGEFAYEKYNSIMYDDEYLPTDDGDEEWDSYIDNDRWVDLRFAALRYKLKDKPQEEIDAAMFDAVFCVMLGTLGRFPNLKLAGNL